MHIKAHQCARDRRAVFLSLKGFYLGPNIVNEVTAASEAQISRAKNNGESKQCNFGSYVAVHLNQHQILSDIV